MLICFLISIAEGDTLSYVLPHYINYFCSPTYKNTYRGFLQAVLQILFDSLYVLIFNFNIFVHTASKHYS